MIDDRKQSEDVLQKTELERSDDLVVYYSRKGNCESAAMELTRQMNADFMQIDTVKDTFGPAGYIECLINSLLDREDTLMPFERNIDDYENIYICSPVWCGSLSTPIKSFLRQNSDRLTGKIRKFVLVSLGGNIKTEKVQKDIKKIIKTDEDFEIESHQYILKKIIDKKEINNGSENNC